MAGVDDRMKRLNRPWYVITARAKNLTESFDTEPEATRDAARRNAEGQRLGISDTYIVEENLKRDHKEGEDAVGS